MHNPWREDHAWGARNTREEAPLPGVIDTIGNGFAALALRPFVALPLLLLDIYLLLMPQLTLRPMTNWLVGHIENRGEGWDGFVTDMERIESFNAFDLAIVRVPLARLPALVPSMTDAERSEAGWDLSWSNAPIWSLIGAGIAVFMVGLLVSALYRSLLATLARPDVSLRLAIEPARIGRLALRVFGWIAIVCGLIALISMPVFALTLAGALLGVESLSIAWLLVLIPISWGYVHFYFSLHALFLDGCGPFKALKASYRVVRRHFWQSVQFILLTFILSTGLTYALTAMAADPAGVFLAIVLNAFVASGMIVAAMLFYRDRAARLESQSGVPVSGR